MALELTSRWGRTTLTTFTATITAMITTSAFAAAMTGPANAADLPESDSTLTVACYVPKTLPLQERTIYVPESAVPALLRRSLSYQGPCAAYGTKLALGNGSLRTFTQSNGRLPLSMGVTFPAATLQNLPTPVSDGKHCFDKDGDGEIDLHMECSVGHEQVLDLPASFKAQIDSPFQWSLTNWNPEGHIPIGVYNVPHFDFHFYIQSLAERDQIRPGPCPVLTNCDDYARAKVVVPQQYRAPDFTDVDAVEPAMGNHLIDLTGPEFNGQPFTHTWIYGTYDGGITFYETMITKAWFEGMRKGDVADRCVPFKRPQAWRTSGWYPTRYCMEYRENRDDYTVALTDFVYRLAS